MSPQHLKIWWLSLAEMAEQQWCGICYNCDEQYTLGHKCKEQNLFHMDVNTPTLYEETNITDTPKVETPN